ncbi:thiazolylpeptide-type bacteriocin, partial [Streptococcus thermophilus]
MKDEKKLFEDLEIDILELDDVEGVPATAASSGEWWFQHMRFHFMFFMFVKLCLRYRISKKGSHKMKDEKKLFEDLEIDILELDDVEGVPATAASSGSALP